VNTKNWLTKIVCIIIFVIFIPDCKGNDNGTEPNQDLPVLTTNTVTITSVSTAISGGTIGSDEGNPITAKGVCWSAN
jgi:hypothetical protein